MDSLCSEVRRGSEEKENLQTELYEYMSRFSELQLHTESVQEEGRVVVERHEEKIRSLGFTVEEKTQAYEELKRKMNELHEDFESRLEAEVNQSKLEYEQNSFENVRLKEELSGVKEKLRAVEEELAFLGGQSRLSESLVESKNAEIEELRARLVELKEIMDGNEWNREVGEAVVSGLEVRNEELQNEINQLRDIEANVVRIAFFCWRVYFGVNGLSTVQKIRKHSLNKK